jgi:hypothetical protein
LSLGSRLLSTAANARLPRLNSPYSGTHAFTLLYEAPRDSGSGPGIRLYATAAGEHSMTINASFDGTNWNKDLAGTGAVQFLLRPDNKALFHRAADQNAAWSTWSQANQLNGAREATVGTAATHTPLAQFFDAFGNRRVLLDHLGMPAGQLSELDENWLLVGAPTGWTWTNPSNLAGVAPNANINHRSLLSAVINGASTSAAHTNYVAYFDANTAIAADWLVRPGGIVASDASNTFHDYGFQLGSAGSDNDFYYFRHKADNANWRALRVVNGVPIDNLDTGIAVTNNTNYRMRLELIGSNLYSGGGGNHIARFFINGTLVQTITNTTPAADTLKFLFQCANAQATTTTWAMGALKMRWNHFATGDAV